MQVESVPKRRSFLCRHILFAAIACMSAEVFLIVTTSNTRSTSHFSLSRQQELDSFVEASNYKRSDSGWKFQQNKTEANSLARNLNKSIRRWGCGLTDTPFIFVHVGKSGGGTVRARLAAASLNFSDEVPWHSNQQAHYPLRKTAGASNKTRDQAHAHFCNSEYHNYRPRVSEKNFEATFQCYATTPLGMAVACPALFHRRFQKDTNNPCPHDPASEFAHVVYVGHNYFGFEMHWLPEPILSRWWTTHWASNDVDDPIGQLLKTLHPNATWCSGVPRAIYAKREVIDFQVECGKKMHPLVDQLATAAAARKLGIPVKEMSSWTPIYASLPVLRAIVMREPFSWLFSKFMWHGCWKKYNLTCHNIEEATFGSGHPNPHFGSVGGDKSLINDDAGPGWARRMALGYIHQICGEDCVARTYNGEATVEELEHQAEGNLHQGFAVIGMLHDVDRFYEMLTARIDYLNMSLNANVLHRKHSTRLRDPMLAECQQLFLDPEFQTRLVAASPEIAALQRLFNVAIEVNLFQWEELQHCRSK